MMKIKSIRNYSVSKLEKQVNDFTENKNVKDIHVDSIMYVDRECNYEIYVAIIVYYE